MKTVSCEHPLPRPWPIFDPLLYDLLLFYSDKLTNIIQTVDFIENMKDMERFDEISKEFLEMKSSIRFEPGPISQLPLNRGKNRYINILPNEPTRVRLQGLPNDFINANRVTFNTGNKYIATQGKFSTSRDPHAANWSS